MHGGALYFVNVKYINISNCAFDGNYIFNDYNVNEQLGKSFGGAISFDRANGVNIVNSNFTNNHVEFDGGAIYFHNGASDLTIDGCNFIENEGTINGGAIKFGNSEVSDVHILNSNFTKNTARYGGAIFFYNFARNLEIIGCTFSENIATHPNAQGGAIDFYDGVDNITIGSTFISNVAVKDGPAISFDKPQVSFGTVRFIGSTFKNHQAKTGVVYFYNNVANLVVEDTVFENNKVTDAGSAASIYFPSVTTLSVKNSNFTNNNAVKGAALQLKSVGRGEIIGSTFTNNHAASGEGGAIRIDSNSAITVRSSNFVNNTSPVNGGAVFVDSSAGRLSIFDSNFTNNDASAGGAVYIYRDSSVIDGCTFNSNTADNDGYAIVVNSKSNTISNSKFNGQKPVYITSSGQATINYNNETGDDSDTYIILNKGRISLSGNDFNTVILNDGKISTRTYANITGNITRHWDDFDYPLYAYIFDDTHNNSIISSSFIYYSNMSGATYRGESNLTHNSLMDITSFDHWLISARDANLEDLHVHYSVLNVTIKLGSYTWLQDQIDNFNGDVFDLTMNVTFNPVYDLHRNNYYVLNHLNFREGMRYNGINQDKSFSFQGNNFTISGNNQARIFNIQNELTNKIINNVRFIDASTNGDGAALNVISIVKYLEIANSTFENNHATTGGAIYFNNKDDDITISNCLFNNNSATSGGAVHFYASQGLQYNNIKIDSSNFTNNKAIANDIYGGSAIGLNQVNGFTLINSNFINNNATSTNGAIFVDYSSNLLFKNSNFTNNYGKNGSAIHFRQSSGQSKATIDDCIFKSNYATGHGGAVNVNLMSTTVVNSQFIENSANGYGGGLYIRETSNAIVNNTVFVKNTAKDGGALDIFTVTGVTVLNSEFTKNNATNTAGALLFEGSQKANITECNFTENYAPNYGAVKASADIYNSNFINNTAESVSALYVYVDNAIISSSNFTYNRAGNGYGAVYITHQNVQVKNSNFTLNTATTGAGIYTSGYNTQITSSVFDKNHATGEGGAVYLAGDSGKVIECNFTNNTAQLNGAAIVMANNNQLISKSLFKSNTASGNGTVYVKAFRDNRIENSEFESNTAYNGGAVYNLGTTGAELDLHYDTFRNNIASHNGGALLYIVDADEINPAFYRDYQNFDGRGINNTDGTTTVPLSGPSGIYGSTHIVHCLFENNTDYLFNMSAEFVNTSTRITLTVPADVERSRTKVWVNITDLRTGITTEYEFIGPGTRPGVIEISLRNLTEDTDYNISVIFEETGFYLQKGGNASVHVGQLAPGQFIYIQRLIDAVVQDAKNKHLTHAYFELPDNILYDVRYDKGQINITFPITIDGLGRYLDADEFCRIFFVNATNVTLQNIEFLNGNVHGPNGTDDYRGGAILFIEHSGLINNCLFHNNTADYGGAVFVVQTAINGTIANSTFYNNSAKYNGGAVDWNATGGHIEDSVIYDNHAYNGGGVFVGSDAQSGIITRSTFYDNTADINNGRGGAIDWFAASGKISNSTFDNNMAYNGGAVFVGMQSGNETISNSNFTRNYARNKGGAIDWNATSGILIDSTFIGNRADYGGAVFRGAHAEYGAGSGNRFISNIAYINGGAVDWNASHGNVTNYYFYNNTAGQHGGAVFVGAESNGSHIYNSTFEFNTANMDYGRGGAVDWYASTGDIEHSIFRNNGAAYGGAVFVGHQTDGGDIINSTFTNNYATHNGGAVDWNGTGGDIENSTFEYNYADYGGAVFVGSYTNNGTINDSVFNYNHANTRGGAIDWNATGGHLSNSNFTGNYVINGHGGAVYVGAHGDSGHIINVRFINNRAERGRGGAIDWFAEGGDLRDSYFENNIADYGGAVFVGTQTKVGDIINSTFVSNKAYIKGGAVDWNASFGVIDGCTFDSNNATYGGGVCLGSNSTNSTIKNTRFINNRAEMNGGAIDCNATQMGLFNTTFTSNYGRYGAALCREEGATGGHGYNNTFTANHAYMSGAALGWMGSASISIDTYFFYNNTADVSGGAIYVGPLSTNCTILNCLFDGNQVLNTTSGQGGAIDSVASGANILTSNFTNNKAYLGGAIYVGGDSGNTTIDNSIFKYNTAYARGGAVNLHASAAIINNTNFTENTAVSGGAIYVGGEGYTNFIYNSNFTKNHANGGYGGAIDWIASIGHIYDTNFRYNTADNGGAIYIGGATAAHSIMRNVVFSHNSAVYNGGAIDCNASGMNISNILFEYNEANYGAALCREGAATGGFGDYNNFTNNHARIAGAALAWLNAKDIKINHYIFINNTADKYGGSIYVGSGSDGCKILNSTFEGDTVLTGLGGSIYANASNTYIDNSTFTDCFALNGGALYVDEAGTLTSVIDTNFTSCNARVYGGAIEWVADNGKIIGSKFVSSFASEKGGAIAGYGSYVDIINSTFELSASAGPQDKFGNNHGHGGAISWENAEEFRVINTTFKHGESTANGGSISAVNCDNSLLYNVSFYSDIATKNGGSVSWVNSTGLEIEFANFTYVGSVFHGGSLFLDNTDATIKNSIFNDTKAAWGYGGAIYADGNVNIINSTFVNYGALDDKGGAIYFENGTSSLTNSSFNGHDAIWIAPDAEAYLTRNNITNSVLGENSVSVYNEGTLSLENNTFDNIILNDGFIKTYTCIHVLDNKTWNITAFENYTLWAKIYDDNNNTIVSLKSLVFNIDNGTNVSSYKNKGVLREVQDGYYIVGASDSGLNNPEVRIGKLISKVPTTTNVTANKTDENTVQLKATVTSEGNHVLTGNVTFIVNGRPYSGNQLDANGIATLNLTGLKQGLYTVTAIYEGDDLHFESQNFTAFEFDLRKSWIRVVVNNIIYGQIAIANITTNANGTVLISFNGRHEEVEVDENGTIIYYLRDLDPGEYGIGVVYEGNEYFEYCMNGTTFNVSKQNTTINATPISVIKYGENQIINVTVNENATKYIRIKINGTEYLKEIHQGFAQFNITGLTTGTYNNVHVEYLGDNYFYVNSTYITFTVNETDEYVMNVTSHDIQYGENATVHVILPTLANGTVTIFVDGINQGTFNVVHGQVNLDNVSGLIGGKHYINATYHGDNLYASKNVTNVEFTVNPTTDWKMDIVAVENPYSENTTVIISNLNNLTLKNITVYIDSTPYTVNITGGVATLTLNNLTVGTHESNATYAGDANYSAKTQLFRLHIVKAQPTVNLTFQEDSVTANVSGWNLTGNVTFYVNGRNYTVNLTDNIAVLENLTIGNNSVVAIYNGDSNHFRANSAKNYEIDKLNSTVNITAGPTVYPNTVEITVHVGENQTGFVKIIVNGVMYVGELKDEVAKFNVTGLDVSEYEVNVTYYGDEIFKSSHNSTKFNVTKANLTADVIAQNVTVENNTQFIIHVPVDFKGNVSITVNGTVLYNGTAKIPLVIAQKLLAGDKKALIRFYGDNNYFDKEFNRTFTVSRVTPELNVTIADVTYPDNATAIIEMSNRANGTVDVYFEGNIIGSADIINGSARINLTRLAGGVHEVTVKYVSNDQYNYNTSANYKFEVLKTNTAVVIVKNGTDVIAVVDPGVTGNVIFWINGTKYENITVNGNATIKNILNIGNNTVTVIFEGNENYTGCENGTTLEIPKITTGLKVNATTVIIGKNTTVNVEMVNVTSGKVIVEINNYNYTLDLNNGFAQLSIALPADDYTIKAYYLGDSQHAACENTTEFKVLNKNSTYVTIITASSVEIDNTLTFTVTTNSTSDITVKVNGVIVTPDSGVYSYTPTAAGVITITAEVNETEYLLKSSDVKAVTVYKHASALIVNATPVVVVGQNTTINVTMLNNESGRVIIEINGYSYIVNLNEGKANLTLALPVGNYTAKAYYLENDKYNKTYDESDEFKVVNRTTPYINITVEDLTVEVDGYIVFNVTTNSTADLIVKVNGVEAEFRGGKYYYYANAVGDYNITAEVKENEYFFEASNYTMAHAVKHNSTINATAGTVTYGNPSEITVHVPQAQNGFVRIIVNGTDINVTVEIINGIARFNATGLDVGKYNVTVTYLGNDKYETKSNVTYFNITKADLIADVIAQNVTVEDNTKFVVTVPDNFNGNVSIVVNNTVLYNGSAKNPLVIAQKLLAGDKNASIIFYGDSNYNDLEFSRNFTVLRVTPELNVTVADVTYPDNATAVINMSNNANGTVNIYVNGTLIGTGSVSAGIGEVDLAQLPGGAHNLTVVFTTSDYYNNNITVNTKAIVIKAKSSTVVNVENIPVGQNATVTITVTDNATGTITVYIDGKAQNMTVTNNKVEFNLTDLAAGNHSIVAQYLGNVNFTSSGGSKVFNVAKLNSTVNVTSAIVEVDKPAIINITGPAGYDGDANVTVDGKTYYVVLENGFGQLTVTGLGNGTYDVKVTYLENDKYLASHNNTAKITVYKLNTTVTINVTDITYGGVANITVNVAGVEFGYITVRVNNTSKVLTISNGTANWLVSGLAAGNYTVTADFEGNYKYNATLKTRDFEVRKANPEMEIIVNNIDADQNATITIYINKTATGKIFVVVNGTTYNKTIEGGKVVITTDRLPAGIHPVNVTYEGDGNYTGAVNNDESIIATEGEDYLLNITIVDDDIIVEENVTIKVYIPFDATGNVTVYIGNTPYDAVITEPGIATLSVNITSEGLYRVNATYADAKYANKTVYSAFRAYKTYTPISIEVNDSFVGDITKVTVTVPTDVDFNVTIEIDGQILNATARNGKAEFNVTGLTAGNKTVNAIYIGDNKYYYNSTSKEFKVIKHASEIISVVVPTQNITVGKNATITVIVGNITSGTILIEVGGHNYTVDITDGNATLTVTLPVDSYTAHAYFLGDDKHNATHAGSEVFNVVDKAVPTITINAPQTVEVDTNITFTVNTDSNSTVIVKVNGAVVEKAADGRYHYNATAVGKYNITAVVIENNYYVTAVNSTNFTSYKHSSTVTAVATSTSYGKVSEITVNVPEMQKGFVKIVVDGTNITAIVEVSEGVAKFNTTVLDFGKYDVFVTFLENDKFNSSEYSTSFNITKANLTASVIGINVTTNDNIKFSVKVDDFKGLMNITIDGTTYSYNGEAKQLIIGDKLAAGPYTAKAVFYNDENYNVKEVPVVFTVTRTVSVMTVNITDTTYPYDAVAHINITNNANGTVYITVDGKHYSRTITNGHVDINLDGLSAGSKVAEVRFVSTDNVTADINATAKFTIHKASSTVNVVIDGRSVSATVNEGATGYVTFYINGENKGEFAINNRVAVWSGELPVGFNSVIAIYRGNVNYTEAVDSDLTTVAKNNAYIHKINVTNIREGDIETINVTVGPVGVTGSVVINVGGIDYYANLTNRTASINITGLGEGNYRVNVTYLGNDLYNKAYGSVNFTVAAIKLNVVGTGNESYVNVTITDLTDGNITLIINSHEYNGTIVNGTGIVDLGNLTPGIYDTEVIYVDGNNTKSQSMQTIEVPKWDAQLNATIADILEGSDAVVLIKVGPGNMSGTVYVDINGTGYYANLTNGQAQIYAKGLKANNYTATVVFAGNSHYKQTAIDVEFKVFKLIINGTGNGTTIEVVVPGNSTNGTVIIVINNTNYTANVTNGTAIINLTNVTPGDHNATIIYIDGNNNTSEIDTTISIPKWAAVINATAIDIIEGSDAVITINIDPVNATGIVLVDVAGKGYYANITEGTVKVAISGIKAGNYTAFVRYIGNDFYNEATTSVAFNVFKLIVNGTGNGTVVEVVVPGNGTNGTVIIVINGTNYTANVTNGTAIVNLTNVTPGDHNATIIYIDGNNNTSEIDTVISIPKWDAVINATAIDIIEGSDAVITININPVNATGIVLVDVAGKGYYANITDGTVKVAISGIKAGNYTAFVRYIGNDYYNEAVTSVAFNVFKLIVNGTGNGTVIEVQVPGNATNGTVIIVINGTNYTGNVTNGTAIINLTNVTPGDHNATIIYIDGNNNTSEIDTVISIPKWDAVINATAIDIIEGSDAVITININPVNATGIVLVDIAGKGYYANITDGIAKVYVSGLTAGNYNAFVRYLGDDFYNEATASTKFNVIKINVTGTGNGTQIEIILPENATGNVTVIIDGQNYTGNVTNGTVIINLTNVTPGEHNATIIYNDGNGTITEFNTTISIPKWDSKVNATPINIIQGFDEIITINVLPANATGIVLVDINGTGYYVNLTSGNATLTIKDLIAGEYTGFVKYTGDKFYNEAITTIKFTVKEKITIDVNNTGDSPVIVIKVPGNETAGNVTVVINGTNYTANVTNGTAVINLTNVTPGEHNATIIYIDGNNTKTEFNTTITVPKLPAPISATADNSTVGKVTVTVDLPSDVTGYAIVTIDEKDYGINLTKGIKSVTIPITDTGDYTAVVTYLGDDKYLSNSTTVTFHATGVNATSQFNVDVKDTPVGENITVTVNVPEGENGTVTVIIDNSTVTTVPVNSGENNITVPGASEGKHNVTVIYTDNDGANTTVTKTITVFNSINAEKEMTRGWNSPYDYKAEFLDNEGHILANTTVQFIVNGKTYDVKTDSQGIAYLDADLAIGTYDVTIINPLTGAMETATTTIVKRIIENKDLTMDFDSGKYYTVRAIGDDGEPVEAGEVVGFKVNGVEYLGITDENGYAKLKIRLNPKSYVITAQYRAYKISNKVKVKQTMKLVKKTVKVKKGKKIVLQAKVKLSNGKAVKGKVIKFKFKGKTYKAKTNKKGIAKVTIKKKSVLKKLTKGKKYKFTAIYYKNKLSGKVQIKK